MRVHIVGLGLMGGSLAGALARAGCAVGGSDPDAACLEEARRRGWIAGEDAAPGPGDAELLVLAMPPRPVIAALPECLADAAPEAVVTDIASVKAPILASARRSPRRARFVGGHPLCGSAGSGIAAADPDLFRGRPWILVPGPDSATEALERLRAMVERIGAVPATMSAEAHDRLLARVSHLPQILAKALARAAERGGVAAELKRGLFGGGWRDMTRLAASPAALWTEILAENRAATRDALAELRAVLDEAEAALADDAPDSALRAWLAASAAAGKDGREAAS
jgi:prephenate dehydrogenase